MNTPDLQEVSWEQSLNDQWKGITKTKYSAEFLVKVINIKDDKQRSIWLLQSESEVNWKDNPLLKN